MFFFSVPPEKKQPKRELVARFGLDKMSVLHTVLRDSLRSNRSSHRLRRRVQSPHFIANPYAIATIKSPSQASPKGRGKKPLQLPRRGREIRRNLIPATEPESHPIIYGADRGSSPR